MSKPSLLQQKIQRLVTLLDADNISFNEIAHGRCVLSIEGCKVGGAGDQELEFDSRRAVHAYLNEKIKLFS